MKIDEEKSHLQSSMGSILTLVMLLLIGVFAQQKIQAWVLKKGVDIASATIDSHFDEEYQFNYERDGLNFAVAFTGYDDVTEPVLDPSYGKLIMNSWSWGFDDEVVSTVRVPLGTHQCTQAELGLDESRELSSKFYPSRTNARRNLEKYNKKFICIDDAKDMFISGSYNSEKARLMNIQVVRCSEQDERLN